MPSGTQIVPADRETASLGDPFGQELLTVHERSTSLDLYAAVRNGFLQRRQKSISDAIRDRDRSWGIRTNRFDEQTESTFNDNQQIQDNSCCEIK